MRRHRWNSILPISFFALLLFACNNNSKEQAPLYTCPMPQDSVFSDKPGTCPKCGMELIRTEDHTMRAAHEMSRPKNDGYTCPMHPQVHSDTTGACPICGMQLEKVKSLTEPKAVSLEVLLKPANQQVVASVPMVHMMDREEDIEMQSFGFITYDTRQVGAISSNISGRIERLYIRFNFQEIKKGQKMMDIYSPELVAAQENLLFLLKNDPSNETLINASKQKLLLLGVSNQQLNRIIGSGKADITVGVYSNYGGYVHESSTAASIMKSPPAGMQDASLTTTELSIKEGSYVQKGQNIFTVLNHSKAWAVLNIFPAQAAMIKVGNKVRVVPETDPQKDFRATISYIEPFYREGSKTLTARVYFDNSSLLIPIGSQVKATVFAGYRTAHWLPEEAVLSLGLDNAVFVRKGDSFVARKIQTGIVNKHLIQVLEGLDKTEAVAANAQYLVDSESFIKVNEQ